MNKKDLEREAAKIRWWHTIDFGNGVVTRGVTNPARWLDRYALPENLSGMTVFLNVLYHMRHPLLALERVSGVTGKQLILETHVDMLGTKRPAMAFYPGAELSNDTTNWFGPNPAAVEAMLKTVGFKYKREKSLVPNLHNQNP